MDSVEYKIMTLTKTILQCKEENEKLKKEITYLKKIVLARQRYDNNPNTFTTTREYINELENQLEILTKNSEKLAKWIETYLPGFSPESNELECQCTFCKMYKSGTELLKEIRG